jgi:uncharacterized membrane protein
MKGPDVEGDASASAVLVADLPDADGPDADTPNAAADDVVTIAARFDGSDPPGVEDTLPGWVRLVGWALLGLQLVAILVFSTVQYRRYSLTNDFADFSQAWWGIAHGHLDPYITGLGVPFWKNNAEFMMWPLSLLAQVYPHPVVLLWVQDAAVVITEFVAFGWIREVIGTARGQIATRAGPWLALGAAVVFVVNPWVYETISYDFHFEPIAALFCVLVGYNLWAGRIRRLWWLAPLVLLCTVSGGSYLLGLGISGALAGRRTRRPGVVLAAAGLAWVVVFSSLGAAGAGGQFVRSSYGYLVGPHHHGRISGLDILVGAFGHPAAAAHVALAHVWIALAFLIAFGMIGVLSSWGLGMALAVLVPTLLDRSGDFISISSAFQSWPAMPFILVGTVIVLLRLLEGARSARRVAVVAVTVWATLLADLALLFVPAVVHYRLPIGSSTAAVLAHVATVIPSNAEVIADQSVVGRFAQRGSVYPFSGENQAFPLTRRRVVFILTERVVGGRPTEQVTVAAVRYIRTRLDAQLLEARSNVYAFTWLPPSGTTQVRLP